MAATTGIRRRPAPAAVASALVAAALALAALTLLAPSSPSYDPFAWIVWGRELMPGAGGGPFGLAGGPSWKPLPVLFTTPFALAGGAAPALWLLVARAGLLLALAGAYALAARLVAAERPPVRAAQPAAGLAAALALLLLADVVSLAWRGASEPLLLACVLWALERALAGRRGLAFALGVAAALIRPEAAPFLLLYAALRWRGAGARERRLLAGGLVLLPLLWVGVPALGGDALDASTTAQAAVTRTSAGHALRGDLGLTLAAVWLLALAALALRSRERALRVLALGAAAWLALLSAMAAAGYAGVARYAMPAAGVASVLAGVGAVALAARVRAARERRVRPLGRVGWAAVALLLAALAAVPAAGRIARLEHQVREGTAVGRLHDELRAAIDRAGGRAALRRCALGGWIAINHTAQSALAWELRVGLDRVARTLSRPGLLVRAPRSAAAGAPAPIALARPLPGAVLARAGAWTVLAVGTPLPAACGGRKASGPPRRIPNI
jgi:hypothetical protein